MEEANSMYQALDYNHDQKVTESDFENLAIRYLCQDASKVNQTSTLHTATRVTSQTNLQTSNVTRYVYLRGEVGTQTSRLRVRR